MNQELFNLISEARQGKSEAFTKIVKLYKDIVFRQAYAMLHDWMEAEDVTQEAFLKAYKSLSGLNSPYAFASWMSRIVCHLCYNHIHKKNKKDKLFADEGLESGVAAGRDPHDIVENRDLRLNIQAAMGTLSPDHRVVIILRDVQGFSYDEIAKILEIPVGTVKSRIHAARMDLRSKLARQEGGT